MSVSLKLNMIEELCQDKRCIFRRVDCSNKSHDSEKSVLGSSPAEDDYAARKLSVIEERRQDQRWFLRRGANGNKTKNCPGFESQWRRSCSSETKHDRRMAWRPKMFVSARRLWEQRPQPWKSALDSSPSEDVFCSSETKNDRRTAPRLKLFILATRLGNKEHSPEKCPMFESR
jgi:hypothetical protein